MANNEDGVQLDNPGHSVNSPGSNGLALRAIAEGSEVRTIAITDPTAFNFYWRNNMKNHTDIAIRITAFFVAQAFALTPVLASDAAV